MVLIAIIICHSVMVSPGTLWPLSVPKHVGGLLFPPSRFTAMAALPWLRVCVLLWLCVCVLPWLCVCVLPGVAATVNRLNCCYLYPLMRPLVAIIVLALPVLSTNQQEQI